MNKVNQLLRYVFRIMLELDERRLICLWKIASELEQGNRNEIAQLERGCC